MAKYYKGRLFELDHSLKNEFEIYYLNGKITDCSNQEFYNLFNKLDQTDQEILDIYFGEKNEKVKYKAHQILLNMLKSLKWTSENKNGIDIIFELIIDEKNNLYGSEILTGLLFPLMTSQTKDFYEPERTPYVFLKESGYSGRTVYRRSLNSENIYIDKDGIRHITYVDDRGISLHATSDRTSPFIGHYYQVLNGEKLKFTWEYHFIHENTERADVYLENFGPSNTVEVEKYLASYQAKRGLFHKRKTNYFLGLIQSLAKRNVFREEIVPKKEEREERLSLDSLDRLMEDIEFLLWKLKEYNFDLYQKYNNIYQSIYEDNGNRLKTMPIDRGYLESLKANIMMCFHFNKRSGMNLIEYLNNLKNAYFLSFFANEEKTNETIQDLDKLMELFLKTQNEYDSVTRRQIIRNFSLLYFFEIYENIDFLDEEMLVNSYLNDNLKTILICINTLKDYDLLEGNFYIDLMDVSLSKVLALIKKIEIKKKDMDYIKKISI